MLALPKGRFFCFLHYRCWPLYVQLFIFNFLCICLLLFGTSFFNFHYFKTFLRWLFSLPFKPPQRPCSSPTGRVWGFGGVASLPRPLTGHKSSHGGKFGFSPQNEFTPPPKGGGAGYHLTWLAGILMQRSQVLFRRKRRILRIRGLLSAVACDNCWPQLPHTASTGLV